MSERKLWAARGGREFELPRVAAFVTNGIKMFVAVIAMSLNGGASASELKPFTTDGCSHFPEGTPSQQNLWLDCCTQHDIAYWRGGSYADRAEADRKLKQCVESVGEPEVALLMLAGVRVGGTPYLPTKFRWGYGWPYPRCYGGLSEAEKNAVDEALEDRDGGD
jgi:hypothetical protein